VTRYDEEWPVHTANSLQGIYKGGGNIGKNTQMAVEKKINFNKIGE